MKPSNILAIWEVKVIGLRSFLIHLGGENIFDMEICNL